VARKLETARTDSTCQQVALPRKGGAAEIQSLPSTAPPPHPHPKPVCQASEWDPLGQVPVFITTFLEFLCVQALITRVKVSRKILI
jgi:hypothetical protein